MEKIHNVLERSKLENMISYLLYDSEAAETKIDTYEGVINQSYDEIFERLEEMLPAINRHDDKLCGAIIDFAAIHKEIFFEIGLLVGFHLHRNLDSGYQKLKKPDIDLAITEWLNSKLSHM